MQPQAPRCEDGRAIGASVCSSRWSGEPAGAIVTPFSQAVYDSVQRG